MEKSIKRVEKLVHATNTALAQMKHSLMFDDMSDGLELGGGKPRKKDTAGPRFLDEEDLRAYQDEFKSEADEMLAKMDKLFGPKISQRKHSKALERIKEINKKFTAPKIEPPATQQSRQKLLTLINQELTPQSKTSADKPLALRLEKPLTPESDVLELKKTPVKSKEELKTKILETQEIVDRGFQTARELSQKVEVMSKKTVSESDGKNSEIVRNKCGRCEERKRMKKVKKEKEEVVDVKKNNVRILEMKDVRVPRLQIQRLPSLHIKDGLRLQKVHNLEVPAGDTCEKVNTANVVVTHEDIEKEKREREIDEIRWNNLLSDDISNHVECFNCGKVIKTHRTRINPKRVDDILRLCNFNVYDPRIDEFVEKCNTAEYMQEEKLVQERVSEPTVIENSHRKTKNLQEMSEHLSRLYKQEADTLEDNHQRLDNILQSLFRRVDESREMFEKCCLLKKGMHKLSMTKPVTISVVGTQKRMNKKDVKNRSKSRTDVKAVTSESTGTDECKVIEKQNEKKRSTVVDPVKQNLTKPTIANATRQKRTFRKSVKLTKCGTQKPLDYVAKSPEMEDKSTSLSTASKKKQPPTSPAQSIKQLEESKIIATVTEIDKVSPVTSVRVQSPPGVKQTIFASPSGPDFEKSNSPDIGLCELKTEGRKSSLSLGSEVSDNPETKPPSPKSEKSADYESDFEGDSEPEVKNKLSTLLEVDSEPKKEQLPSQDTTPTELVSSLKEIISALKDQFTRTETLAEKLTENIPPKRDSPNLWPMDSELVLNLQSARKELKHTKKPLLVQRNQKPEDLSMGSLSEGGSSIGEVISKRKSNSIISENLPSSRLSRVSSGRRDNASFKLKLNDDVSYSEGEIPSILNSEGSARSVGEVPSEKTSGASSID